MNQHQLNAALAAWAIRNNICIRHGLTTTTVPTPALMDLMLTVTTPPTARLDNDFGPGESGFSHCADHAKHDLFTSEDADRPYAICDRNGEVVLSLCRRCGRGESELEEACARVLTP